MRQLSMIFSPTMFNNIVRNNDSTLFEKKVSKYFKYNKRATNLQVIKSIYKQLLENYRCEYVYKNKILLEILNEHSLSDTVIFDEFKVGNSMADLVMLNGSIRVFEIKTELDNLDKLIKQIEDYQKIANEINIVTNEKFGELLFGKYKRSKIGIIILNKKNKLSTIKKSENNESHFDALTLFKILRKQEYLELVKKNFKCIPDVPNTKIFKECFHLLETLDVSEFQKQVLGKLKERRRNNPKCIKARKTPAELKQICNALNFREAEYEKLYDFLNKNE